MNSVSKFLNCVSDFIEKEPKFNVTVVILSIIVWVFTTAIEFETRGFGAAVGVAAMGVSTFCTGGLIVSYLKDREEAEKKQEEAKKKHKAAKKQQNSVEEQQR